MCRCASISAAARRRSLRRSSDRTPRRRHFEEWRKAVVRIVVLGGGFGGVTTARHLERRLRGAARRRDHAREPRELLRPHAAPVRIVLGTTGTAALCSADPRRSAADALHRGDRRSRRRRTPDGASRFAGREWLRPAIRPSRRGAGRVHERAADSRIVERVHLQDDGGRAGVEKSRHRAIRARRCDVRVGARDAGV